MQTSEHMFAYDWLVRKFCWVDWVCVVCVWSAMCRVVNGQWLWDMYDRANSYELSCQSACHDVQAS